MGQSSETNRNLELEKYGLEFYQKDAVVKKVLKKNGVDFQRFTYIEHMLGLGILKIRHL